ncbi:energy-coupling factor transporter transmembrane component T family protein [Vagococcus fluvialis]|jgi:energy-coupling factor transport system permease protein|uniref:Energy-coupling factor transporter transmembrane protein EcfT n=2 Tax=Vagococcus fluvialis TaxID=2738 RepID=A0A7X6DA53_9ENTE|nr:energy-coupling factor transporter transmembrane component T [Vagococcus fluvialis]MBO0437406.1 energy-coupling factor transporter transmembrane protein EcfT [Vagococcus fluvialis]MCM2139273.1 energy-coupling factor transporter transmembrane protein EcfT [Vagococcus fluvialis]NKC68585.1 energy-coupling factor transporter transmembrane protein EcfT [Vagococcus fluvialis]UDM70211.1 energy-coupling factor transporter transmembrane protein EcfT [Vagococcus fluvialis]UDM77630.1 energy-coupling f
MKLKAIKFDPRSKLATVMCASFLLMLRVDPIVEALFVLMMFFLLTLNGGFKKGFLLSLLYSVIFCLERFLFKEITGPLTALFSFFLAANRLLIPPIMGATFAANNNKMSEWIAAMKKMKVPTFIVVPFSVVCRFFPVLIQDFKEIRRAMKFRGIGINSMDLVKHPLLTLEYIIVPILVSVENTSVELSAASLVRGLGSSNSHTSIYEIKFKLQDYLLILLLILFFAIEVI